MTKIGDRVRFLNTTGGGIVKRIEGNIAYVDDDGFETPTLLRELVVVAPAEETARRVAATADALDVAPAAAGAKKSDRPDRSDTSDVEETPEGEKLNIVLAYEPVDVKHLSTSGFDTYLVNDSNYYLYFTYMTRADTAAGWTTRYAGLVEPSMQVFLEQIRPEDLAEMDRLAVQIMAFKMQKEFKLKNPVGIEMPLPGAKFFKLHCFHPSAYFDTDVLQIELVTNDAPRARQIADPALVEEAFREKKRVDRPVKKPVVKRDVRPEIIEVDLHISKLLDNTAGLSNADMLNIQVDEFRRVMDENLRHKGQKIVFIHGKGEGVLRQALLKELKYRYKTCRVQDASFREYGFGATQVTI